MGRRGMIGLLAALAGAVGALGAIGGVLADTDCRHQQGYMHIENCASERTTGDWHWMARRSFQVEATMDTWGEWEDVVHHYARQRINQLRPGYLVKPITLVRGHWFNGDRPWEIGVGFDRRGIVHELAHLIDWHVGVDGRGYASGVEPLFGRKAHRGHDADFYRHYAWLGDRLMMQGWSDELRLAALQLRGYVID